MRWIVVFLLLYLIPLIVLFKNYKNFKRSCIYSSIYIVLVTTIVISNIYISGLNRIKDAMYYHNYAEDEAYKDKYVSNFDERYNNKLEEKESSITKEKVDNDKLVNNVNEDEENNNKVIEDIDKAKEDVVSIKESDLDIIFDFKKDIYDIERNALIPMRDCMPYTKNIVENLKNLSAIREELIYAKDMCENVVSTYEIMDIPKLSKTEYTQVLSNARNDIKKAYELRQKAMEASIKLVDTKNPKYAGKITEYLKLSDKHIESFKQRITDLKNKVNQE